MSISPINLSDLGPAQKDQLQGASGFFVNALISAIPQLGGHFMSGGIIEIKTMSGLSMRIGFDPMQGGLIIPGGIKPISKK